jgi:hypothetical protein
MVHSQNITQPQRSSPKDRNSTALEETRRVEFKNPVQRTCVDTCFYKGFLFIRLMKFATSVVYTGSKEWLTEKDDKGSSTGVC